MYRDKKKGLQILLSYSQAGPGIKAKQGQEEISRSHVQAFFLGSVFHFPISVYDSYKSRIGAKN